MKLEVQVIASLAVLLSSACQPTAALPTLVEARGPTDAVETLEHSISGVGKEASHLVKGADTTATDFTPLKHHSGPLAELPQAQHYQPGTVLPQAQYAPVKKASKWNGVIKGAA